MRSPRPFEQSYGVSLTVALLALTPFIMVTTAYPLYRPQVMADVGATVTGLEVMAAMATAGYAFGALLGGDLVQRFPQRPLFLISEALFVAGALLAALAGDSVVYGSGRVLQGLATGLLLVVALPPVVQRFGPRRMPFTAAFVNIGFFGATAAGPLIGGAVGSGSSWRLFYAGLAAVGVLAIVLALLTLPDGAPPNPGLRPDRLGIGLALAATVLPFYASAQLSGHGFRSLIFMLPLAVGAACFVALLVVEYHRDEPLSPVKPMWTTIPVLGTIVAMIGGGAFVTFLELAESFQLDVVKRTPFAVGILFWPQVIGVLVAAALLALLLRTRLLPLYVLAGMLVLIAGGALLVTVPASRDRTTVLAAAGLLGLGAGATVSPGLWLAGFSLPAQMVGRTFALVELVRSEADYLIAPVLMRVAVISSGSAALTVGGVRHALRLTVWLTVATTVALVALWFAGGASAARPDLEGWLDGEGNALESPPLLARLRRPRG